MDEVRLIKKSEAQVLLNYLIKRPYFEVAALIKTLLELETADVEDTAKVLEK